MPFMTSDLTKQAVPMALVTTAPIKKTFTATGRLAFINRALQLRMLAPPVMPAIIARKSLRKFSTIGGVVQASDGGWIVLSVEDGVSELELAFEAASKYF